MKGKEGRNEEEIEYPVLLPDYMPDVWEKSDG